ncbi:hypothetical protein OEZ86_008638 [Tetradesmus obliquus]|nr:hypothetical protein OEZ86_008638 [Tetradesmus obliquus]
MSSLSSSPGKLRFTAVVGAGNRTTGAVVQLELLPGCASGPTDSPPEGGWPWNVTACAASAVGQQCLTCCNWRAFSGSGYYVTCLPDGSWSGPGGFCFPWACSGSPGPEWAGSSCTFMTVGSQCTAACPSGQQGSGYAADCIISGWQVAAKNCSDKQPDIPDKPIYIPIPCKSPPGGSAPSGSTGWPADCAGKADGETCKAECDKLLSYTGGYTALCQAGQWTVQQAGGCKVCETGKPFAAPSTATKQGAKYTDILKMGVLPTNDGKYVLVADYINDIIAVYSAKDLSYVTEWTGITSPSFLAQAPGAAGHVYVTNFNLNFAVELDPTAADPSATIVSRPLGNRFFRGVAVGASGKVYLVNAGSSKYLQRSPSDFSRGSTTGLQGTPFGVAVNRKSGNVYITDQDNGAVLSINSASFIDSTFITGCEPQALTGVAVDAAGNIILLDHTYGKLMKYDSSGKLLSTWGGKLSSPNGVHVGDGVVWVTEAAGSAYKIMCM